MEVVARWKWKRDGSGRSMEVEARWKWKADGSGSAIVTAPNGPNEPPYCSIDCPTDILYYGHNVANSWDFEINIMHSGQ